MIERYRDHDPQIDETAFVHAMATVIGQVTIGAESSIWPSASLRGDDEAIVIGARTSIQDGSVVHTYDGWSPAIVGDRCTVGHGVNLHGCTIEDECVIGIGAIVLDGAVVGRRSFVAAGSLITPRTVIPPGSFVLGSPARVVRPIGDREAAAIEKGWQRYLEQCRFYRDAG